MWSLLWARWKLCSSQREEEINEVFQQYGAPSLFSIFVQAAVDENFAGFWFWGCSRCNIAWTASMVVHESVVCVAVGHVDSVSIQFQHWVAIEIVIFKIYECVRYLSICCFTISALTEMYWFELYACVLIFVIVSFNDVLWLQTVTLQNTKCMVFLWTFCT